jgi:uncharacterized membrane protein
MSDTAPLELIVSAYQTEKGADEAMATLKAAKHEHLVKIRAAATVRRDDKGKLHIKERGDVGTGTGAGSGAALGAAVGLFGGPIGAALGGGAGAAIGGLSARLIDSGIPDDRLKQLGEALTPGTSAFVALVEHSWVDEIRAALAQAGGDIMASVITADVAAQLASGREVAYDAIAGSNGAVAASRVTADGEEAAVGKA